MVRYFHRQMGSVLLAGLGAGVVICLGATVAYPSGAIVVLPVAAGLLVVALLLSSLSIEITDSDLRWTFGPGLIRKRVPLADISDAQVTRIHVWEGWGIHLTFRGWLYNVTGFQAVAVRMKSGKRFMLGSDDAEQLAALLRAAAAKTAG